MPVMYQTAERAAAPSDAWAQAHLRLIDILTREHTTPPERYTAARDFCQEQARLSPADAYDWQREVDHWQAQLERVQGLPWAPSVPASDEEVPF